MQKQKIYTNKYVSKTQTHHTGCALPGGSYRHVTYI